MLTYGQSRMQQIEKDMLCEIIPPNGRYLEIGTLSGASVSEILDRRPDVTAVCVDSLDPGHGNPDITEEHYFDLIRNYRLRADRMTLIICRSMGFHELTRMQLQFDTILIDADHDYFSVCEDLDIAGFRLRQSADARVVVHDYASEREDLGGVKKATDRFCAESGKGEEWTIERTIGLSAILKRTPE